MKRVQKINIINVRSRNVKSAENVQTSINNVIGGGRSKWQKNVSKRLNVEETQTSLSSRAAAANKHQ
jgi:hypothetical protein